MELISNYMTDSYIENTYNNLGLNGQLTIDLEAYKELYMDINKFRVKNDFKPITNNNLIDLLDLKGSNNTILTFNQWIEVNRFVKSKEKAIYSIKTPFIKDNEILYYKNFKVFYTSQTEPIKQFIDLTKELNKFSIKSVIKGVKICRKNNIKYNDLAFNKKECLKIVKDL